MDRSDDVLVSDEGPNLKALLQEYHQAGAGADGIYGLEANQDTRRMVWPGQSRDGRRWDENMPEGEPALPWNGASDTRVPVVDSICNDETAVLAAAFSKAELHAVAVDPERAGQAASVSAYLHWLVHTKFARALRLEVELSGQYSREFGHAIAYVGWERELGKRRIPVTIEQIAEEVAKLGPDPEQNPFAGFESVIADGSQEDAAVEMLQALHKLYVVQALGGQGFFDEEIESLPELSPKAARKAVRELRQGRQAELAMPYVCRNQPLIYVGKPFEEIIVARGTTELQKARAIFWRRYLTEADLDAKRAEGWDEAWIEEAKKTKGQFSAWATTRTEGSKMVGGTRYYRMTEDANPLIEVVYGYVKAADEDGVTGIYETIFSPHVERSPDGQDDCFCAKCELLNYGHGRYPFVEYKRENLGRGLAESRSVAEIAGTWQNEEKKQRDMLFNRADWDTLPPVRVPKLGGVEYRLGPGAQVPLGKAQEIEAINLGAAAPTLSLELIQMLRLQADGYFGMFNPQLDPARTGAKQAKSVGDFYSFWGEVLKHMYALTLQFNPQEIVRVTGTPELAQQDPFTVLEQFDVGLEFDVQELNPDYLLKKIDSVHGKVLPADAAGVIDRAALTQIELRMLDPRLAAKITQDKGQASQKVYRDVELNVMKMSLGNEAEYTQGDPTAPMKLQFLQTIVQNNPKYQKWLQRDRDFQKLMANYEKNLQMSVKQEENKVVGALGVKPMAMGGQGGS